MEEIETIADDIESISDSLKRISKLDATTRNHLISLNTKLQDLLSNVIKALFSSDSGLANKVIEDRVTVKEGIVELNNHLHEKSKLNSNDLQRIIINLDTIRRQIVDIAQHVIDMVVPVQG